MFDWLAELLGYVMYGCLWLVGNNYVIALLIFALAMQILLCPFGIKQQRNMVKQAHLRPKEMAIRKKYAGRNDAVTIQKLRTEIMQLHQDMGYSATSGCLPMLLQLILIFPIYSVTIRPLEFVVGLSSQACNVLLGVAADSGHVFSGSSAQVQLAGWLGDNRASISKDLIIARNGGERISIYDAVNSTEVIPDVTLFGQDLGATPFGSLGEVYWWLFLIPFINLGLTYLSQYLSQKMQYKSTLQEAGGPGASMKIMMIALPLLSLVFTGTFAAAIGIYWIFRTILSMVQQYILHKAMPYPVFTEQDYKNAEREMKGKAPKRAPDWYVGGSREIRSLHHIDDDDED